uniref:Uncharacterized protein n=1 Tax=Chromera velia CCMP2878 TaxID=1169474 RepID=A0A0G4HDN3_9ALVE|eukprot:Cvel_6381.t1-p1 / transcript=Cvel_6381.t1 / gene=Cvel_6381 / organism=Chromera_velia_CCMP2878 / gene_product=hypothetical protein / transcript_product=hypothetical protein / location=Cvel_scaffold311:2974-9237(+) / protein_length=2088 / sequence_SO=supercontig / SO=protein_coding / is_pseudo=false
MSRTETLIPPNVKAEWVNEDAIVRMVKDEIRSYVEKTGIEVPPSPSHAVGRSSTSQANLKEKIWVSRVAEKDRIVSPVSKPLTGSLPPQFLQQPSQHPISSSGSGNGIGKTTLISSKQNTHMTSNHTAGGGNLPPMNTNAIDAISAALPLQSSSGNGHTPQSPQRPPPYNAIFTTASQGRLASPKLSRNRSPPRPSGGFHLPHRPTPTEVAAQAGIEKAQQEPQAPPRQTRQSASPPPRVPSTHLSPHQISSSTAAAPVGPPQSLHGGARPLAALGSVTGHTDVLRPVPRPLPDFLGTQADVHPSSGSLELHRGVRMSLRDGGSPIRGAPAETSTGVCSPPPPPAPRSQLRLLGNTGAREREWDVGRLLGNTGAREREWDVGRGRSSADGNTGAREREWDVGRLLGNTGAREREWDVGRSSADERPRAEVVKGRRPSRPGTLVRESEEREKGNSRPRHLSASASSPLLTASAQRIVGGSRPRQQGLMRSYEEREDEKEKEKKNRGYQRGGVRRVSSSFLHRDGNVDETADCRERLKSVDDDQARRERERGREGRNERRRDSDRQGGKESYEGSLVLCEHSEGGGGIDRSRLSSGSSGGTTSGSGNLRRRYSITREREGEEGESGDGRGRRVHGRQQGLEEKERGSQGEGRSKGRALRRERSSSLFSAVSSSSVPHGKEGSNPKRNSKEGRERERDAGKKEAEPTGVLTRGRRLVHSPSLSDHDRPSSPLSDPTKEKERKGGRGRRRERLRDCEGNEERLRRPSSTVSSKSSGDLSDSTATQRESRRRKEGRRESNPKTSSSMGEKTQQERQLHDSSKISRRPLPMQTPSASTDSSSSSSPPSEAGRVSDNAAARRRGGRKRVEPQAQVSRGRLHTKEQKKPQPRSRPSPSSSSSSPSPLSPGQRRNDRKSSPDYAERETGGRRGREHGHMNLSPPDKRKKKKKSSGTEEESDSPKGCRSYEQKEKEKDHQSRKRHSSSHKVSPEICSRSRSRSRGDRPRASSRSPHMTRQRSPSHPRRQSSSPEDDSLFLSLSSPVCVPGRSRFSRGRDDTHKRSDSALSEHSVSSSQSEEGKGRGRGRGGRRDKSRQGKKGRKNRQNQKTETKESSSHDSDTEKSTVPRRGRKQTSQNTDSDTEPKRRDAASHQPAASPARRAGVTGSGYSFHKNGERVQVTEQEARTKKMRMRTGREKGGETEVSKKSVSEGEKEKRSCKPGQPSRHSTNSTDTAADAPRSCEDACLQTDTVRPSTRSVAVGDSHRAVLTGRGGQKAREGSISTRMSIDSRLPTVPEAGPPGSGVHGAEKAAVRREEGGGDKKSADKCNMVMRFQSQSEERKGSSSEGLGGGTHGGSVRVAAAAVPMAEGMRAGASTAASRGMASTTAETHVDRSLSLQGATPSAQLVRLAEKTAVAEVGGKVEGGWSPGFRLHRQNSASDGSMTLKTGKHLKNSVPKVLPDCASPAIGVVRQMAREGTDASELPFNSPPPPTSPLTTARRGSVHVPLSSRRVSAAGLEADRKAREAGHTLPNAADFIEQRTKYLHKSTIASSLDKKDASTLLPTGAQVKPVLPGNVRPMEEEDDTYLNRRFPAVVRSPPEAVTHEVHLAPKYITSSQKMRKQSLPDSVTGQDAWKDDSPIRGRERIGQSLKWGVATAATAEAGEGGIPEGSHPARRMKDRTRIVNAAASGGFVNTISEDDYYFAKRLSPDLVKPNHSGIGERGQFVGRVSMHEMARTLSLPFPDPVTAAAALADGAALAPRLPEILLKHLQALKQEEGGGVPEDNHPIPRDSARSRPEGDSECDSDRRTHAAQEKEAKQELRNILRRVSVTGSPLPSPHRDNAHANEPGRGRLDSIAGTSQMRIAIAGKGGVVQQFGPGIGAPLTSTRVAVVPGVKDRANHGGHYRDPRTATLSPTGVAGRVFIQDGTPSKYFTAPIAPGMPASSVVVFEKGHQCSKYDHFPIGSGPNPANREEKKDTLLNRSFKIGANSKADKSTAMLAKRTGGSRGRQGSVGGSRTGSVSIAPSRDRGGDAQAGSEKEGVLRPPTTVFTEESNALIKKETVVSNHSADIGGEGGARTQTPTEEAEMGEAWGLS